jgi:CBS-domain-containing membrane protein
MNIQTVADNLKRTIAGKEYMLQELVGMQANDIAKNIANDATIEFLKINIDELKRILQDVEQCIEKVEV